MNFTRKHTYYTLIDTTKDVLIGLDKQRYSTHVRTLSLARWSISMSVWVRLTRVRIGLTVRRFYKRWSKF